jgi:hypothetical protein
MNTIGNSKFKKKIPIPYPTPFFEGNSGFTYHIKHSQVFGPWPTKARILCFRSIIEYSSRLRDFGPLCNRSIFYMRILRTHISTLAELMQTMNKVALAKFVACCQYQRIICPP